ncbi:hypothetical protein [Spirosoma areae]
MKTLLSILLCIGSWSAFAQQKTYDIALSYGAYTSPGFEQNHSRDYF